MSTYKFSYISLKNELREFDKRSKHSSFGDHFNNSRNLFSWWCNDNVKGKLMLITPESVSIIAMSVEVVNNWNRQLCDFRMTLKWKRAKKNSSHKRTEIKRFDWFIERKGTPEVFGWLSELPGDKTACPRTFYKSIDTSIWRHTATRLFWSFYPLADKTNNEHLPKPFSKVIRKPL